ncbi:recombinase family protein [Alicyclobacillus tolerans]|uniref:recombinase family protein n=1 Tax=Alicyclobacillus tolerans TaxID=90970 RepID=UPI001F2B5F65|nr:recombinase family protein [Alicyclobacillus tolerans]MCF8564882.1 recombinase family protein [Alicyclobacillus tolerans]
MPTCAIYARVSDESQVKGDSIEHQVSFCQEIARRRSLEGGEPWITPESLVYIDQGITGTSLVKRAQVQRLIRDARTHLFDVVLFKGISRFARDTVDALLMLRTLLSCNVRVVSMEENFDSQRDNAEFVFTIHSALAQAESEKTAIRVRMGAMQKARAGQWNGRPPDGYLLNPQTKRLEIDESFAPVIREIFELYVSGYGARRIADTLNQRGLRTKRGFQWTQRNVARVVQNPVYVGDVAYGRRERHFAVSDEHDLFSRKKVTRFASDERNVVMCTDAHSGIVDRDTFGKAAAARAARRTRAGRAGKLHLLAKGLMRCNCGGNMTIRYNGSGTAYYRCLRQMELGRDVCDQPYVRADEVETAVLQRVQMDAAAVFQFDGVEMASSSAHRMDAALANVERELTEQMRKSRLLFDKYSSGVLSDEQYERLNLSVRERITQLRGMEAELTAEYLKDEAIEIDPVKLSSAMKQLLSEHSQDLQTTRQLLETLIDFVVVQGAGVRIHYRFNGD